jgi:hypothetical protein
MATREEDFDTEAWFDHLESLDEQSTLPDQEEPGDEEEEMPTTTNPDELAPLGESSTVEDYFDDARTSEERAAFALEHPKRFAAIKEKVDAADLPQVPRSPTEERFAELAELVTPGADTIPKSLETLTAMRGGAVKIDDEDLEAYVADLEAVTGRSALPETHPEHQRHLRRLEVRNSMIEQALAPGRLSTSISRSERFDPIANQWVVTEHGREVARYTNEQLAELQADRRELAAQQNKPEVLTRDDVRQMSAGEWMSFRTRYPKAAEQILEGAERLTQSGGFDLA